MNAREPIDARRVSILPVVVAAILGLPAEDRRILFGDPEAADHPKGALKGAMAATRDPEVSRPGRLRAARRLAHRKAGTGPDPGRFERPPSAEVRKSRKAIRRKLARAH